MAATARKTWMTREAAAAYIEQYSAQRNDAHYGIRASWTHYTGGGSHNDDRLRAEVADEQIRVSDGCSYDTYRGPRTVAALRRYVDDWLAALWQGQS